MYVCTGDSSSVLSNFAYSRIVSLPGSSIHGISQARMLEWVAVSFSRGSSQPRDGTHISGGSCIGKWILDHLRHLGSPELCEIY